MKFKVCGMKFADNILEVAKLAPHFMGFIFYKKSKRFVGDDFVIPEISSDVKKVGVFVNDSIENILDKVNKYKLDLVQLHGDESPEFCRKVGERVRVVKAFGIDEQFDFVLLNEFEDVSEFFLFDTKTSEYGGSGKKFDRSILLNYQLSKPFFLSGGIDLGANSGLETLDSRLFALDLNSKFEIEPGLKDINKIKIFQDELSGK